MKELLLIFLLFFGGFLSASAQKNLSEKKSKTKVESPHKQYALGKTYEYNAKRKNLNKAVELYKKAAKHSYDSALFALGRLHAEGKGIVRNDSIALAYFEAAAKKGHTEANFRAAERYEKGIGTKKNADKAVKYYLKAYGNDYPGTFAALNRLDSVGAINKAYWVSKKDKNYLKYKRTLINKIDLSKVKDAQKNYELGNFFNAEKKFKKALSCYQKAADKNHPEALFALGMLYKLGNKTIPQNNDIAIKYFISSANLGNKKSKKALETFNISSFSDINSRDYLLHRANTGDVNSQFKVYHHYRRGTNGFEKSIEKAISYCQKAAWGDHVGAIMTLGNLSHKDSYESNANPKQAFMWFKKAADLKNDSAKLVVAQMYEKGLGVEKNEHYAIYYYVEAANGGISLARHYLSKYDLGKYYDKNALPYVEYKAGGGDVAEQLRLGKYFSQKNSPKAIKWLAEAAKNGKVEASRMLGDIYLNGKCQTRIDYEKSFAWYTNAAEKKDLKSTKQLAYLYSKNFASEHGNYLKTAFKYANQYIDLAKKDSTVALDPRIYEILGNVHFKAGEYKNAIVHYSSYLSGYEEKTDTPLLFIEAIKQRGEAYFKLRNFNSAALDAELGLAQLKTYEKHRTIAENFSYIKGLLAYLQAKSILSTKDKEVYKACFLLIQAEKDGVVVDEKYKQFCEY